MKFCSHSVLFWFENVWYKVVESLVQIPINTILLEIYNLFSVVKAVLISQAAQSLNPLCTKNNFSILKWTNHPMYKRRIISYLFPDNIMIFNWVDIT